MVDLERRGVTEKSYYLNERYLGRATYKICHL